ncbi:MAG TPA: ammonium transporter [Gemmataceae bacterium]|nr:ammonium transporter [Gemmataceae bacterium]
MSVVAATILVLAATSCTARADAPAEPATAVPKIDAGDTAWMLVATGLVLLMVPGLALFYGGMVRRKNVLGTMMHSMVALAIVGIQWVLIGYCLAFGESQGGWIGWSSKFLGLNGVLSNEPFFGQKIPIFVHCMYQGMFAIITPALISGAFAERIKFGPYCLFIFLWATLVYDPLAHWVWSVEHTEKGDPAGWLAKMGALDFAGGTVVHISAGLSGLASILLLRKRIGYPEHAIHPNSMVLTLLGAGLLWFGWFGFNGGSALGANGQAGAALTASQVAAAAAALSWIVVEWLHRGKPTALGFASGIVAGLVAVTPASGFVSPLGGLVIGLCAGAVCYVAVCLKPFFKYDDSLDAFGVHGVGGFLGAILTGVFVSVALVNAGTGSTDSVATLVNSGRFAQIGVQLLAASTAVVYAFVVTFIVVKVIDHVWGFCLDSRSEGEGLDRSEHGEVGFDLGPALESAPERPLHEPRPASVPPDGQKRFTVVLDGADQERLIQAWSALCQAGPKPPAPEFLTVYPYVTTVQGNRFRFRGGNPETMRDNLLRLFRNTLGQPLQAHLDPEVNGGGSVSEGSPADRLRWTERVTAKSN